MTAEDFTQRLLLLANPERAEQTQRYFKTGEGQYGAGDQFVGVAMGPLNALAKEYLSISVSELDKMLQSPIHEVRMGACSIMNQLGRKAKTSEETLKALYDLYLRNTAGINNWDLVDTAAGYVVGRYLFQRDRKPLYQLAQSPNLWERRTAMVATSYFIRQGDLGDTFHIAEMLLADKHDLIHKATGWMLREAGQKDERALRLFLDKHAAVMPRTMLRYALEKFDTETRRQYMEMKMATK